MKMARTVGMESLEQKIEKAQGRVSRTKAVYDSAVDDLQKLLDKRTALQTEELVKSITNSSKSYEEIMQFITENNEDNA